MRINMERIHVNSKSHYSDVIVGAMASEITIVSIVYSTVVRAQIKENIKVLRHWPFKIQDFKIQNSFIAFHQAV